MLQLDVRFCQRPGINHSHPADQLYLNGDPREYNALQELLALRWLARNTPMPAMEFHTLEVEFASRHKDFELLAAEERKEHNKLLAILQKDPDHLQYHRQDPPSLMSVGIDAGNTPVFWHFKLATEQSQMTSPDVFKEMERSLPMLVAVRSEW